jgi:hypothetical protein
MGFMSKKGRDCIFYLKMEGWKCTTRKMIFAPGLKISLLALGCLRERMRSNIPSGGKASIPPFT